MPIVSANPNEYLVVGRKGKITNRGTGLTTYLLPGSIYVYVPSTKHETKFEITQESQDGIPLRFKGIVIFRITDPATAAQMFTFRRKPSPQHLEHGIKEISSLINHICMGELRSIVAYMTMQECIEQRKTTLTEKVENALREVVDGPKGASKKNAKGNRWGIDIEVVQVAQVFIVDEELRKQLEAEVRNEIKSNSDQSEIRAKEETKLAEIISIKRVKQEELVTEKQNIQNQEEMEMTKNLSKRRLLKENLETEREKTRTNLERFHLEQEAELEKIEAEAPVQLMRTKKQQEIQNEKYKLSQLINKIKTVEVETQMLHERAKQELRVEMLPIEQMPEISDALSRLFQGMNLSIYGEDSEIVSKMVPIVDVLLNAIGRSGILDTLKRNQKISTETNVE
jgi:regulator of protease activity HflC (stomatin/prohibitin superfamily)